jgi:hypothetical protein
VCYGLGTLVVPVRLGLDPYGFIGRFQAASFDPDRESVFELLAVHPQTRAAMVDPVIGRFAGSWSWDNTRAAWPAVRALPREAWTAARLARVRTAGRDNVDVREAGINEGPLRDGMWPRAPEVVERHLQSLGIPPEESSADGSDDDIPF